MEKPSNASQRKIPVKLLISVADNSNDSAAISVKSSAPMAKTNNKLIYVLRTIWTIISVLIGNYQTSSEPDLDQTPKSKPISKPGSNKTQAIEIRIVLPFALKAPHKQVAAKFRAANKKSRFLAISGCAAVVVIIIFGILSSGGDQPAAANAKLNTPSLVKGTPSYHTILPAGKTISDLGGWTRISPSNSSPVYTYVDTIGDAQINVSEQPLPARFRLDTANQIEQLAHDFSANDRVMAGNTPFYVGTSEHGPQSVILVKSGLLILIKSTSLIRDSQWAEYIRALN